nr:MAG TPA: hypothetical protein [Caudoviricetes sp.]
MHNLGKIGKITQKLPHFLGNMGYPLKKGI